LYNLKQGRYFYYWNQPVNRRMRVCYLDCHEAGLCCHLVIHTENLLHPLHLLYFPLWPKYWLALVFRLIALKVGGRDKTETAETSGSPNTEKCTDGIGIQARYIAFVCLGNSMTCEGVFGLTCTFQVSPRCLFATFVTPIYIYVHILEMHAGTHRDLHGVAVTFPYSIRN
jgi:hypothetical protein